jgi:hypothetical protein
MLGCALAQFIQEPRVQGEDPVVLFEMTLGISARRPGIDAQDLLDRADILAVAELIKRRGLFGYRAPSDSSQAA